MTENQIVVDNSARSTFRGCKKKYYLQNIKGLQSIYGSTALRYGSTWHAIQEGYYSFIKKHGWSDDPVQIMAATTAGLVKGKECYDADSAKKEYYDDFKNFNTAVEAFSEYLEFFKDDKNFIYLYNFFFKLYIIL